jgi:SagB-type dehydrogenase family enzyme
MTDHTSEVIKLPRPRTQSGVSVENAIERRRSVREFSDAPISLSDLSQLIWAAQGVTGPGELRAAPSAGATYPLEVYVVAARVTGLPSGIFNYRLRGHELVRTHEGEVLRDFARASVGQSCVEDAAAVIVLAAVYERTTGVYGQRGIRYVDNEIGHAAENVWLQAVALGLGTVAVGAFDDDAVAEELRFKRGEKPLYLLPVGKPR